MAVWAFGTGLIALRNWCQRDRLEINRSSLFISLLVTLGQGSSTKPLKISSSKQDPSKKKRRNKHCFIILGRRRAVQGIKMAFYTEKGIMFSDDCLLVMRLLRSGSINTVFADPPFNLGKEYGNGRSDEVRDSAYVRWCKSWLREAVRVLKPGGSLFVYNLPKWNILLANYLMGYRSMCFRHWIAISCKNGLIRGRRLYPAHYSLVYFTKGVPAIFNRDDVRQPIQTCRHCKKVIPDWGGYKHCMHPGGVNLSDVWTDISPVRHSRRKNRPSGINELNPKIPERVILLTTNPGDIICDPFGGGGSTYKMAEKHNRLWVGAEIGDCKPIEESLESIGATVNPSTGLPKALRQLFKQAKSASPKDRSVSIPS